MSSSTDLHFRQADWHKDRAILENIRQAVFVEEQGVSQEEEWDGEDAGAWHFCVEICARQKRGAVACARIIEEPWQGKPALHIGRVAVLVPWRGRGIGHFLMSSLLAWCSQPSRADRSVFLHAQTNAIEFYQRLGFYCTGETFMDAGIAHRTMVFHAKPHHSAKGDNGHGQKISG